MILLRTALSRKLSEIHDFMLHRTVWLRTTRYIGPLWLYPKFEPGTFYSVVHFDLWRTGAEEIRTPDIGGLIQSADHSSDSWFCYNGKNTEYVLNKLKTKLVCYEKW